MCSVTVGQRRETRQRSYGIATHTKEPRRETGQPIPTPSTGFLYAYLGCQHLRQPRCIVAFRTDASRMVHMSGSHSINLLWCCNSMLEAAVDSEVYCLTCKEVMPVTGYMETASPKTRKKKSPKQ